jgi:hypothetical protein
MPSVSSIVLADAQGTPVNHTFIPLGQDSNGVWWFEDQSPSDAIGYNKISLSLTRPSNPAPGADSGNRMARVKIGIHTPVLETLGTNDNGLLPPATVAFVNRANLELMIPERASLQNRKDLRKYAEKIFADSQVIAMAESLQAIY